MKTTSWLRGLVLLLLSLWVWATQVSPPTLTGPPEVLALGRCVVQGLRAGVDYVYTYGPLGAFLTDGYTPELFWTKVLVWEGVLKLVLAVILVQVGLKIRGRLDRVLFFLLLAYPIHLDSQAYVFILAVIVWMFERERLRPRVALLGMSILAAFSLAKFVFLAPAVIGVLILAASRSDPSSRGRRVATAAAIGATFLGAFVVLWWIAGQDLRDVPTWVRRSLQVSSGYSAGLSTPAPPGLRSLAFVVAGLVALQSALLFRSDAEWVPRKLMACAVLPILWIVFKAGFVRASDHTPIFFGFTLLAPFLLATANVAGSAWKWAGTIARPACVVLSLAGTTMFDPADENWGQRLAQATKIGAQGVARGASMFVHPADLRAGCEGRLADARISLSLPRTRKAVGDRSIDMISYQQQMLFLNDLAWRPRPVFQSYVTLSPVLQELNARFLESERACEFILFHLETIDERLPTMDDALGLQVVARDYEIVLAERGYLLLHRNPRPRATDVHEVELERTLAFGETLDLSALRGTCHLLQLDIPSSAWGRVRTLLDSAPEITMEIGLSSGWTARARIIPSMIRAGMILDPFLGTQRDWMAWYTGDSLDRPVWLRIPEPESRSMFGDAIGVKVLRADGIAPRTRPDLATETLFSLFKTVPFRSRAARTPAFAFMYSTEVLLFPAPSEMRFRVGPGAHTVSARYGILPRNWRSGRTGGADFSGLLRIQGQEDLVVFSRHMDPTRVEADQRLRFLQVSFEAPAAGTLILRTDAGSEKDGCNETVWTGVEVD